jgi:hypothetical protein
MSTYLLPISDGNDAWIEHVSAKTYTEAETKFIKGFAEDYDFIDLGGNLDDAKAAFSDNGYTIGEIYDIEEF